MGKQEGVKDFTEESRFEQGPEEDEVEARGDRGAGEGSVAGVDG